MEQGQLNWVANFIWGIADDVLWVWLSRSRSALKPHLGRGSPRPVRLS